MVLGFGSKQSLPYIVLQLVNQKNKKNGLIINNGKIKGMNQGLGEILIEDRQMTIDR